MSSRPMTGSASCTASACARWDLPDPELPMMTCVPWFATQSSGRMRVREVMLPEQILAVVISVRRPHHGVDVIADGFSTASGTLVIEFDKNHWTLHAIVERTH